MKAAVLHAIGQALRLEERPMPEPAPDEVLLRVRACGIDGTDLKLLDGFGYAPALPFVMGHEIAGEVVDCGAAVNDFAPGDRAVVYNFLTCGICVFCRAFREQLCQNMRGIVGILNVPGGYAEYVALPSRQLIRLPDGVDPADGATCCDAGMTALHAVDRAHVRLGDKALVIGIGGVGSLLTQLLAACGVEVVASDIDPRKQAWALEQGASAFVKSDSIDSLAGGVDRVIDVVGLESTMRAGFAALRPGGRMVVVGYTPESFPLPGKALAQNEIEIIGTRAGGRDDLARCVDLFADGTLRSIVRARYRLEQVNQALERLRGGITGRIVLEFD